MQFRQTNQSRRAFLRGKHQPAAELRPPWSQPSPEFESLCSRCAACLEHCPQKIIKKGDGGFPVVDFSAGECTFCADCVASCETGALLKAPEQSPWQYQADINERCLCSSGVQCMSCREECPRNAIDFQPTLKGLFVPEINQSQCNGCGACVAICPTRAITISNRLYRDDKQNG